MLVDYADETAPGRIPLMMFWLSKLILVFLTPITWVLALILLCMRYPARRKAFLLSAVVVLAIFSNPLISTLVLRGWEIDQEPAAPLPRTAIVLTGVMKPQDSLDDLSSFRRGADRATAAVELYKLGLIERIIVSGGDAGLTETRVPESHVIAQFMRRMGIPQDAILIEDKARNTTENAAFTKELLAGLTDVPDRFLLITSAFHMRRAVASFAHEGLEVTPMPVDVRSDELSWDPRMWLFPTARALDAWEVLLKEWVGYIVYIATAPSPAQKSPSVAQTISKSSVIDWIKANTEGGRECIDLQKEDTIRIEDDAFIVRDLDGDGSPEAIVTAWACLSGTGGPDVRVVLRQGDTGSLEEVPMIDNEEVRLPLPMVGNSSSLLQVDANGRVYAYYPAQEIKWIYEFRGGKLFLTSVEHPPLGSPSFSCEEKGLSQVEIAICWNRGVSAADRDMVALYEELRTGMAQKDRSLFEAGQKLWLKQRDEKCEPYKWHYPCLEEMYSSRIKKLRALKDSSQ